MFNIKLVTTPATIMNEILHQNAFNKIKLDSSTNSTVYIWVAIQTRDKRDMIV